jgi:hypothetical protein
MKTIKLMAVAALFAIGFAACEKIEETKLQNDSVILLISFSVAAKSPIFWLSEE